MRLSTLPRRFSPLLFLLLLCPLFVGFDPPRTVAAAPVAEGTDDGDEDDGDWLVDAEDVYYGDPETFDVPAVLSMDDVFLHIPPYKKILEEGLTTSEPRYWILLTKANEIFDDVLVDIASRDGYDLIAEIGAVSSESGDKSAPVITKTVTSYIDTLVEEGEIED